MELSTGKMIERLKRGFNGIIMGYSLIASGYLLHSYGKLYDTFFYLVNMVMFQSYVKNNQRLIRDIIFSADETLTLGKFRR